MKNEQTDHVPDTSKMVHDQSQLTTLTKRAEDAEAERDELREIVWKCRDHLDGCSHGYSDELWDSVNEAADRAGGAW